jgi:hypothetical protein
MATTTMTPLRTFFAAFLLVSLLIAGGLSYWASSAPDGLEKVAADHGISEAEKPHHLEGSPLAGYAIEGVSSPWASGALAGVGGVLLTLAVGGGLFALVRRREPAGAAVGDG